MKDLLNRIVVKWALIEPSAMAEWLLNQPVRSFSVNALKDKDNNCWTQFMRSYFGSEDITVVTLYSAFAIEQTSLFVTIKGHNQRVKLWRLWVMHVIQRMQNSYADEISTLELYDIFVSLAKEKNNLPMYAALQRQIEGRAKQLEFV